MAPRLLVRLAVAGGALTALWRRRTRRDGAVAPFAETYPLANGPATNEAAERDTEPMSRERAVRYSRTRERLFLVDLLWGWAIQMAFLSTGQSSRLRDAVGRVAPAGWRADMLYTVSYSLLSLLANLPLAYYRGYLVEHRFGLSNQNHRAWLADLAKGTALGLAFEAPLAAVAYGIIRRSPRWWWLILSGMAVPFTVILAQIYPVLIAPIFNKFVPVDDEELVARIRAVAARAGVTVAEVTRMDMSRQTRKANAFFAGLGPTKRIALGDTLLGNFTTDEVEVIVAHELGHQAHRDIWKGVALGSVVSLGGAFFLSRVAEPLARRFRDRLGFERLDDPASAPLLGLLLSVLSVAAMPISNAFSRVLIERPADRYALDLTGKHGAFISAMEKLVSTNLSDPEPPLLVEVLLHSHPPIAKRVQFAREHQAAQAGGSAG